MMTLCGSQMFRHANLALVGLTVLLVSNVAHAAPATAITTCPFVITGPGQYYLATDLTCPGDGININHANGVRLDLNGHTLQGLSGGDGIVAAFSTGILIQGPGTITGFLEGLLFFLTDSSNVIEVTVTRNRSGFFVDASTNNVFQGNVVTLNDFEGFSIDGDENTIVNNLVMNNQAGIDVLFASLNKIYANIVTGNTLTGISLRATQNAISGNTALDNAEDMFDSAPNCDHNRWRGNQFDTANQPCIQ